MNELNVYCTYSTYMMVHAMDHAMMTNINVIRDMAQSLFPLFFKLLLLLPTITLMIRATSALGVNQYTGYNGREVALEMST